MRRVDSIYLPEMLGYQDIALLPLRQPDQPLQDEVIQVWNPIRESELRRAEEEAAAAERLANGNDGDAAEGGENNENGEQNKNASPGQEGEEEKAGGDGEIPAEISEEKRRAAALVQDAVGRLQPLEPDVPAFNAVVFSHPLGGGLRLARAIAKRHTVGVVNVQAVMNDLMKEVCASM